MVKLTGGDAADYNLIPENEIINVRLVSVEEKQFTFDGETVDKLRWTFTILDDPWKGNTLMGDTSTSFNAHPNCKAYQWAKALTGKDFNIGEEFDTDMITGHPARALIKHRTDKQGRVWPKIGELLPPRARVMPENTPF